MSSVQKANGSVAYSTDDMRSKINWQMNKRFDSELSEISTHKAYP